MSGWGCVHEIDGTCGKVAGRPCDPGMKGCILAGRFRFTNPDKNRKAEASGGSKPEKNGGVGGDPPESSG
jgi:hypothetical protein